MSSSGGAPANSSGGGDSPGGAATIAGSAATLGGAGSGGAPAASAGSNASGGAGAGAGSNASGGSAGSAQWSSDFPTFTKHEIASFSSGYATVVVDIDHDGKLDVVALSSASAGLVWFKNPTWDKFTITTAAKQLIFVAPNDVDGDGDVDLAFISDFDMNNTTAGGTVSWAESPGDPTTSQDWALHKIGAIPTSHRLRWADLDGNGKKELLDLPLFGEGSTGTAHAGAVKLTAFTIPSDPKGTWMSKVLDDKHLEVAHGLEIVDWDGDKADDILTAANDGVQLFRPSLGGDATHLGAGEDGQAPDKGSSEVALGSLGGARFFATIEPWHGTDGVIYTPGASTDALWTRQVLGSDFEHGHGMVAADFNGDGFDEVVGGGGQGKLAELIYRYVPSSKMWEKIELDMGGVAVSCIDVKDINGDGAPDIVVIGGSPTNNLVWYENSR
jgi:aldos-2-ulose dehydratase/isomerase family protein/VCBS repeat protein